ncbi:MAG: hypothetical protein E4G93_03580 [Dehalococcoidia bacterium]|nr:MAG: hypothetical protein E4G93_03580 [Dehalococcoidia bacterium]
MSNDTVLTVRFHESVIALDAPPQIHPGLGATVAGVIGSSGLTEGREVAVLLGHEIVGTSHSGPEGDFRLDFRVAEDAVGGEALVKAVVLADDSGKSAPFESSARVEVTRVEPVVEVTASRMAVIPSLSHSLLSQVVSGQFEGLVTVSVDVYSSLPLGTVQMSAVSGERQVLWTQDDVHSEVQVPVEGHIWEMGRRLLFVTADADEPWHSPSVATAQLTIVNLFVPCVVLVFLGVILGLGVLIGRRLRTASAEAVLARLAVVDSAAPDVVVDTFAGMPFDSDGGPRLLLARLYFQAVGVLQKTLGVMLRREMTLREYLSDVRQRLGAEPQVFGKLTTIAEDAVYGAT